MIIICQRTNTTTIFSLLWLLKQKQSFKIHVGKETTGHFRQREVSKAFRQFFLYNSLGSHLSCLAYCNSYLHGLLADKLSRLPIHSIHSNCVNLPQAPICWCQSFDQMTSGSNFRESCYSLGNIKSFPSNKFLQSNIDGKCFKKLYMFL